VALPWWLTSAQAGRFHQPFHWRNQAIVKSIGSQVQLAVADMQQVEDSVATSVSNINQAGESVQTISQQAEEVVKLVGGVSQNVAEQQQSCAELADDVSGIAGGASKPAARPMPRPCAGRTGWAGGTDSWHCQPLPLALICKEGDASTLLLMMYGNEMIWHLCSTGRRCLSRSVSTHTNKTVFCCSYSMN
jgi:hypothetical protein